MKKATVEVHEVPEWAITQPYPYWVCKVSDGKLVFFGAYRTRARAEQAVEEGTWQTTPVIVERVEE